MKIAKPPRIAIPFPHFSSHVPPPYILGESEVFERTTTAKPPAAGTSLSQEGGNEERDGERREQREKDRKGKGGGSGRDRDSPFWG
ncbi:hypothetical protein AVEN_112931-1 [Araneus ventricosus]|uniref:Uncharacterized protein n=1 Tax=Araneus ventricosus TaxID=182803 RepID=A0A4Y2V1V2_ARAVE|nr:hypothetical protein AVEN_112931-1 [Araneus ventricosus]